MHRGNITLDGAEISGNDSILNGLNNYKDWKCWGGLDMITINQWGKMFRSDCEQGGPVGDLKSCTLPTEPQICGANECSCLSDIYLRKDRHIVIKPI